MKTVTPTDLRNLLLEAYGGQDVGRIVHRAEMNDNYGDVGSIFFSLGGSPPKAFALHIIARGHLVIYDSLGKVFKKVPDCLLVEEGDSRSPISDREVKE